jgi:hypothetical protein
MMIMSTTDVVITAKTLHGTNVTVKSFDVIIHEGQPMIVFFVKTEQGHAAVFNHHQLTDYQEV